MNGLSTPQSGRISSAWWLVMSRELADLWVGGKALNLILIYSVILGGMVYLFSSNSELSLIPPKEAVYEMFRNAMEVSLFIGLIIGADAFSGERDRTTLESLLLTPVSRRQIVMGKFLAGISQWPIAFLIAIPFMKVLSQGDEVLPEAIMWGAVAGTLLVVGYTGLGMLVSFWSGSNRTSYFVSLGLYAFFLVPAQLPGSAQAGAIGQLLQWVNPLAAMNYFLSKHLIGYEPVSLIWRWLVSPGVLALGVLGLLFVYAGPGLRLEAGRQSRFWGRVSRVLALVMVLPLLALPGSPVHAVPLAQSMGGDSLEISIDMAYTMVKTGDKVEYTTRVVNNGTQGSSPLIVAMNLINLDAQGDVVDPEDWSPERTQYIQSLGPGETAELRWIINTILAGDYMVYMVMIPAPGDRESTSQPIATSGIHLTVTPFTRLNPGGVLPYVIGTPLLLLGLIYFVYRRRRQQVDLGGSL